MILVFYTLLDTPLKCRVWVPFKNKSMRDRAVDQSNTNQGNVRICFQQYILGLFLLPLKQPIARLSLENIKVMTDNCLVCVLIGN